MNSKKKYGLSISQFISTFYKLIPITWPSILSIILVYVFFWQLDQGQAILVDVADYNFKGSIKHNFIVILHPIILIVFSIFLALTNTFLPLYRLDKTDEEMEGDDFFVPIILGAITLLISGLAISHIAEIQEKYSFLQIRLAFPTLMLSSVLLIIFRQKIAKISVSWKKTTLFILLLLTGLPFGLHAYLGEINQTNSFLYYPCLLISPIALSLLFISGFSLYKNKNSVRIIRNKTWKEFWTKWSLTTFINMIAILSLFILFLTNIASGAALLVRPSILFFAGIIFYNYSVSLIGHKVFMLKGKFWDNYKAMILVIACIVIGVLLFSNNDKKFPVHTISNPNPDSSKVQREKATIYAKRWVDDFKKDTLNNKTIYLVASYGGGIRAAYWTNLVLARLEETDPDVSLYDNIFSLTGASGGMLGAGIYMHLGNTPYGNNTDSVRQHIYGSKDFLSPSMANFFGKDIIKSFWPIKQLDDRHRELEETIIQALPKVNEEVIEGAYEAMWNDKSSTRKPLLIATSAWSQKGLTAIYSPVEIDRDEASHGLDIIEDVLDSSISVPYYTAVLQSARFPYMSTLGSLGKGYQFLDAGYIDNLGAGVTVDMLNILTDALAGDCQLFESITIKVLVINSSAESKKDTLSYGGLTGPVRSFTNLRSGYHVSLNNTIAREIKEIAGLSNINIELIEENISLAKNSTGEKAIFPLGWYLSDQALRSMLEASQKIYDPEKDDIGDPIVNAYYNSKTEFEVEDESIRYRYEDCELVAFARYENMPEYSSEMQTFFEENRVIDQIIAASNSINYQQELSETRKRINAQIYDDESIDEKAKTALVETVNLQVYQSFLEEEGITVDIEQIETQVPEAMTTPEPKPAPEPETFRETKDIIVTQSEHIYVKDSSSIKEDIYRQINEERLRKKKMNR